MRLALLLTIGALTSVAVVHADEPLYGSRRYPQFRDLSALPGGGFGVSPDGYPTISGAMAISTPIGFSVGHGRFAVGLASRSHSNSPEFPNTKGSVGDTRSDGTAHLMAGVTTPLGNLTGSVMFVSSEFDNVQNFQLQLPLRWRQGGVSLGVQNLFNRPSAAGVGLSTDRALSRSVYLASTVQVFPGAFVTAGFGDARFRRGFFNASASPVPRVKLTGEYDGYGWNTGVAYSFGPVKNLSDRLDRIGELTLWAGFIQQHYATVALTYTF